jgi:hypothetical protein
VNKETPVPSFRFADDKRQKVKKLLAGDERKVIKLENHLSDKQAFVIDSTEIGPYFYTIGERMSMEPVDGDYPKKREEYREVKRKLQKLKEVLRETEKAVWDWPVYEEVARFRMEHDENPQLHPLDIPLHQMEQCIFNLEGWIRHYGGPEKDLRRDEMKEHVIRVVLSLFPGKIPVEGYQVKRTGEKKVKIYTDQYTLAELVLRELGIEPGDFRKIYEPAAKRLNKIRQSK